MDPNFETIPSTMYQYDSQTDKVLKMERIFITPKKPDNDDEDEAIETQSDEDVVPNESYSDALNHFLKPGESPPRTLTGSDIIKPEEFQAYFRPRLNLNADDEANEELIDAAESEDNDERADGGDGNVDSTETQTKSEGKLEPTQTVNVEAIKQEKQWRQLRGWSEE